MHIRSRRREGWILSPSLFIRLRRGSSLKNSRRRDDHTTNSNRNIIVILNNMFRTNLLLSIITTRTLRLDSNYNNNMSITYPTRRILLLFLKRWSATSSSQSTCLSTTATSMRWCARVSETKSMTDTASPASINHTSGTASTRKLCTGKQNTT